MAEGGQYGRCLCGSRFGTYDSNLRLTTNANVAFNKRPTKHCLAICGYVSDSVSGYL